MTVARKITKWQSRLGLDQWQISTEQIQGEQVVYAKDCPDEDKFFIGIQTNTKDKTGIIYHDIDLYEEAIAHELLHVKYPDKSERWINEKCSELMSNK